MPTLHLFTIHASAAAGLLYTLHFAGPCRNNNLDIRAASAPHGNLTDKDTFVALAFAGLLWSAISVANSPKRMVSAAIYVYQLLDISGVTSPGCAIRFGPHLMLQEGVDKMKAENALVKVAIGSGNSSSGVAWSADLLRGRRPDCSVNRSWSRPADPSMLRAHGSVKQAQILPLSSLSLALRGLTRRQESFCCWRGWPQFVLHICQGPYQTVDKRRQRRPASSMRRAICVCSPHAHFAPKLMTSRPAQPLLILPLFHLQG